MEKPSLAAIRDAVAQIAHWTGVTRPRSRSPHLTVVTLHRVLPEEALSKYPLHGLALPSDELQWLLEYLTHHYVCGPLTEMADRWIRGQCGSPPLMAITFDDGQRDNYMQAKPLLEQAGVRATFYIPVAVLQGSALWHDRLGFAALRLAERPGGEIELRRMHPSFPDTLAGRELVVRMVRAAKVLTPSAREALIRELEERIGGTCVPSWASPMGWDELEDLVAAGHEIGSHSATHPILPRCTDEELEAEIGGSRRELEQRLRTSVQSFCYPDGAHDPRVVAAVSRAGYRFAVTTNSGINRRRHDALRLRRLDLQSRHCRDRLGRVSTARIAFRLTGIDARMRDLGRGTFQ